MQTNNPGALRLERIDSVCARTGLSRSSLYRLIRAGEFPASLSLAGRSRCWSSAAVDVWIQGRISNGSSSGKAA